MSCFECLRTGDECKPAASRRGGNFSHLRRTKQPSKTTSIPATSPPKPGSTGVWRSVGNEISAVVDRSNAQEPTYAELKNPCDALQILANIAATETQSPFTEAAFSNFISPNIRADVESTSHIGFGDDSATMHSTPSSSLPRSEAEKLVKDGLGEFTAIELLHL